MNKVATTDARTRTELFGETAERKNLAEAIVEKDFIISTSSLFWLDGIRSVSIRDRTE